MNGMNIEMQVKKAVLEKSLPKDLLEEIEYRLGIQEVEIENDPEGWGTTELDYTLAFDDTWDFVVWNLEEKGMKKMHNQVRDFLIDIGYYISYPHPDWKYWLGDRRMKVVTGAEFKYKNQYWQVWEEGP
tara:strand:+ start:721 stop:1107 length:387 start_codon:yes stop_codon:yes gene_type:complete